MQLDCLQPSAFTAQINVFLIPKEQILCAGNHSCTEEKLQSMAACFQSGVGRRKKACQLSAFPILTTAFPPCEASASSTQCSHQGKRPESEFLCIHWVLVSFPTQRGTTAQGHSGVKQCWIESPGSFLFLPCNWLV